MFKMWDIGRNYTANYYILETTNLIKLTICILMNSLLYFIYYLSSRKLTQMQINRITGLKSFLFIIMLTFSFLVQGIDTLYNSASFQNKADSIKIMLLKNEAMRYFSADTRYSLMLIDKALLLSENCSNKKEKAEMAKLAAYGYLNSDVSNKAISILNRAEAEYMELDDMLNLAFIHNMYFLYYMDVNKDDSVVYYYHKSLEDLKLVEDKQSKTYFSTQAIINTNIGNFFFFNRKEYNDALVYYDTALYYAGINNDTTRLAASYSNIGIVYKEKKRYGEAQANFEKAYKLSLAIDNKIYAANILGNLGDVYTQKGDFAKSIEYKKSANNLFIETGQPTQIFKSSRVLASAYLNAKKYAKSKSICVSLIADTTNVPLREQMPLFSILTKVYKGLNNTDSALYYHEIYSSLSMRLQRLKNFKATEELIIAHKTEQALKDNQLLSIKYKVQLKRHYQLIVVTVVMFLVIILLFFNIYQRKKLQIAKRKEIEIENKLLKEKLEFKNKELTISTMNIIRHSEFVSSLVPELKELYLKVPAGNKNLIGNIVQKINMHNKTELWDDFYRTFTEVNGSFFEVLNDKFPKLSVKERKLCALLKLEMSTKDIASITNTSTRGVETARHRLRKKLELTSEDNLCVYLRQIG